MLKAASGFSEEAKWDTRTELDEVRPVNRGWGRVTDVTQLVTTPNEYHVTWEQRAEQSQGQGKRKKKKATTNNQPTIEGDASASAKIRDTATTTKRSLFPCWYSSIALVTRLLPKVGLYRTNADFPSAKFSRGLFVLVTSLPASQPVSQESVSHSLTFTGTGAAAGSPIPCLPPATRPSFFSAPVPSHHHPPKRQTVRQQPGPAARYTAFANPGSVSSFGYFFFLVSPIVDRRENSPNRTRQIAHRHGH